MAEYGFVCRIGWEALDAEATVVEAEAGVVDETSSRNKDWMMMIMMMKTS